MMKRRPRGAILILTLWILTILTILSIGIAGRMGLELKLTGLYRDDMKALYLAKAGVERAVLVIQEKEASVNSLNEPWSNNDEEKRPLFKETKVDDEGIFTVGYRFTEERFFYGAQDEERRININNASDDMMGRLIKYLNPSLTDEDAYGIASSIEDWRDADSIRVDGTDEGLYSEGNYPIKDAHFDVAEEVLLVKGMTREIFDNIKDYITVYPNTAGKLNVNTASAPSLVALGLNENQAKEVISMRAGVDGIEGTEDDDPFENSDEFKIFVSGLEAELAEGAAELADVKSFYFRVLSYGQTFNGKADKFITCVVMVSSGESKVLFWDEE